MLSPGGPSQQAAKQALPLVVVPTGRPAAYYGGPPAPSRSASSVDAKLRLAIEKRISVAGFPAPAFDGRMDQVATDLAALPEVTSHELISFLGHHYGLAEPQPNLLAATTNAPDDEAVGLVMNQVESLLVKAAWPRMGLAAVRVGGDLRVILLLGIVGVSLEALPRTLPAKGSTSVKGTLPQGFGNAQLVVTNPAGGTGRLPMLVQGNAFTGTFACVAGSGRYDVEVMAEAKRGPEVMINVPVFCDAPPPTQFVFAAANDLDGATSSRDVEAAMVNAINRERAKRNQAPVVQDARLQQVAHAHSVQMAQLERTAHLSPTGVGPVERVRAAGLSPSLLSENVGSATAPSAVHEGFMASPGHRANVIEPLATHVGVGVAITATAGGPTVWYVTELFARFTPLPPGHR